ncbi:hypothetical protein KCU71_g5193, partial [Aureobasidium melanogenum]
MQQFLNRFIKLNMEEKKDLDLDLMIVVVDDLNKTYTEISRLPMAASRSPAPLKGKNAKECFEILKKLKKDTGSEINVKNFAVLDGRSVEDDIVLLVQAFEKTGEIKTVRAALKETDMALYEPDNIDSGGLHSSKGHPDKSPNALLSALASLRAKHEADEPDFHDYLSVMFEGRRIAKNYVLHGSEKAQLSGHNNQRVIRAPREDESPQVFYGIIGSGDLVMNNGAVSSLEAADDNTICFEMEERGVMSDFPYLVIRGISDYADSYENDQWQPYAAMTAAAYAKELLGAVSVQEVERLDPARKHLVSFSLWKMPATDRFIQRDEDMRKLEDFFLSQASRSDRRKVFAIHGVSGIGKTQLCNEFARKHRARYTAVLWMDGTSEVALQQSFVEVFSRLPVEEMPPNLVEAVKRHEASADRIVKGVLDWLSLPSNQRWLHIIDNVDHDINAKGKDPLAYDLEKYSAQVDHGSLLIISRVSTLTVPQDAHQLTEMNPDEARALFENHRGKPVSVQPARDESKDLESLLRKLDGMPLALAQAGSYIRETNTSLRKYLVYYDNTLEELVADQDSYPSHDPTQRSMLATWMISYQQIESQSWEGATLLKLWAFLDPKDIWDELLTCAIEPGSETDLPEWLSTLAKNSSKLYDVRRLLREYCFVNKERDYSMHAVLHPWCRHLASISSTSERFPELAVSLVTHSLSSKRYKDRELIWMRLYPHGQQLLHQLRLGMIWKSSCIPPGAYDQLVKLFEYNRASEEVTAVLESVLEEREKISGTDHPKTADTAYNLARVYLALKRHAESQKLAERALAVYERSLGSHPGHSTAENVRSMICTLECLGLNYEHQMRPEDAEDMYKRAIAISEQQQHTKHNNALGVMALLGDVYTRRARFAEAVLVFERALEVSKEIYGPFHHLALQFAIKLGKVMRLRDQKIAENTKILQQLLRAAKIPSGKHCVSLHQWEYPSTIETWRASSPAPAFEGDTKQESRSTNLTAKMLETVTISGYSPCFEAMTCEQYVRKRWGSIGIQVATFLTEAAQLVQNNTFDDLGTQVQIQKIELVIKQDDLDDSTSEVVAFAAPDYVCLFVQNLDDSKIQKIQETAQWICQTFRSLPLKSNDLGALQMSRFSQPADLYPQAGLKVKAFGLLPLEPLEIHQANCWTALFEAGVVAETTCSEGPELEGIEMSFDLMTALAAVETYHYLQHSDTTGGLILLGFFTALVPVSFHQSGVIQWHFEYSETDILRPMDLESTQKPWEFVNAPSRLSGGRCIVGIWPQANIMLGVQGTRLDLEDSGLPHRSSVTLPKGVEVTAGLSPSAGPVQVVAQITRSYEQVTTRQRFSRANAYVTALNRLSQAVSLIYDCKTHTGWLVPQMSLLLHLCHAYWARSITSKRNSNPTDPIPWAKPSTDGASAAFDAFTGSGDIVAATGGPQ